jgi:hypothetical protein
MDKSLCDGGPLTNLSYDQTLGNFSRFEGGTAMSGSWSQEANCSHNLVRLQMEVMEAL